MIIKSKCGKYDILIDDEDLGKVTSFAPNGWEAKYTTGANSPYAITRKTIKVDGKSIRKQYYMHRLIMDILDKPDVHIDHIDGTLDNRKSNLREATRTQNMKNRKSAKNSTSRHLGVHYCAYKRGSKKWRAVIKPDESRNMHLGYYYDEESGGYAYNLAAEIIHGKFANLNKIDLSLINEEEIKKKVYELFQKKE